MTYEDTVSIREASQVVKNSFNTLVVADGSLTDLGNGEYQISTGSGGFLTSVILDSSQSNYYYYGGNQSTGNWKVNRFSKTDRAKSSATQSNNPSYTNLTTAWNDKLSLNYT